ncbi:tetratricopeptide repeat protein, partial [bacterium]|nr:tetratricopeptide repeat protein [bacterium]
DIFNKILNLESKNITAIIGLAKIYSWNNRYRESIDLYKRALDIDTKNIEAQTGVAEVYNWIGYRKESIDQYEKILGQEPRNLRAYKGLAEVYIWDDRLKEAENIYQKALQVLPQSTVLHNNLAKIYTWMGAFSNAEEEYRKTLQIEPGNKEAMEGKRKVEIELMPGNDFVFKYTKEKDCNNWRAYSLTSGYKHTIFLDHGNNFYLADYLSKFKETGHDHKIGNNIEFGGKYNFSSFLSTLGSIDLSTYSNGPYFLAGMDIRTILKYYRKNSITFKYVNGIFDILDEIGNKSYGIESNLYFKQYVVLNSVYNYADYSDNNSSEDWYNLLTFIISKRKPDLNFSYGYRERDFKINSIQYYSPQNLKSKIYSIYMGNPFKKNYLYGMFKVNDNSDHIDSYYYLIGNDCSFSDKVSFIGEISYFDTEKEYNALTLAVTLKFKF